MIKVLAQIKLYNRPEGRRSHFTSGYRPLFNFKGKSTKVSGSITLINANNFKPGMTDKVEIDFLPNNIVIKDLSECEKFTFDEGQAILGEGEIIQIISR